MDGYILDGRSLRVNFARPPKYYQDRFPSFNARRAAQNRAEGSISANNTSSASPQQRLNVTTKGSINHRKMDATLPRLPGADTHSYHSPTESRPTGINVTERNRNTSVPDTGEPPGDRFHNRPGVVPDLRHPYAHFFPTASISDLDHNERSLHATEARLDQNSSALSRYPKDPLSVMPEDILERLGSKYEAEVARAYSRPSGRQEHFIGGEQLTHAGQIGGEDNPNAFSSAEDRYNYGHGSMIGLRQSTDRSALFSPQDARSDLSGHPLNSTSNAAGQGSAEAFAPSQAVGGDFGTVQGVRNEFEGPLLEQSQKKLSAPCHDDDGAIQTPEVDQKASARPHNRASPEKHKVRRNKSSNNSSPTKAVAYSKARSRETSDSGVIDTHTELSHSSKNRGFSKEPPQPGHQPSIAHKEAFQETPINSSPTFAVVNSGASKVDNGDVVATHSSGRASSASEIREPVQIVAKPNSRPGSARGQALESSEHSHLKAVTPSAGKTKKVPKGKKKTVAMTGDKPLGTQSAKLVQQSTAKNNPRTMPQLSTEYSASQGVPSGSGSAVIPKHDSATNMPETTIEATGNISLEETILRSSPRGRTQGGPGYDVQNSGEPTVAGPVPRIRSAASSPTQRLDRVASAQLDQSNSSNAKTIKDNVSNRIKSHSVNPLDTVLVEQSIGEKEVLKSEEPQRLSGSTSKARKMATGQPRAKQATAEINQKRAVPKSRSTSRTKKNTEEAGATRASICTAPDLNSRSVFPDLGVILDKAKCEGTEDTTPAKLSRSLQARKPNKPTQNVHAQILNHGNHDQCITPLDDKAEGAQPLRHQSSVSGDVIEPKETQLSIEEAHDKHVSDANEDGVSEAQPAKPRSWSEVVGLSTLSSQSQKQAATESEVAPPTVSDPWAIDEGTSAWAGKSINTDNTTVQSHGRNHAPQGKKVTKSENAKRDTPGSASTKKENVNTLKKKSKDASSQVPAGKRKGSQKEQVSAGDGMVDP